MITVTVILNEKEVHTLDATNYVVEINGDGTVGEHASCRLIVRSTTLGSGLSAFYDEICEKISESASVSVLKDETCVFTAEYFSVTYNVSITEDTERLEFVKKY